MQMDAGSGNCTKKRKACADANKALLSILSHPSSDGGSGTRRNKHTGDLSGKGAQGRLKRKRKIPHKSTGLSLEDFEEEEYDEDNDILEEEDMEGENKMIVISKM